MIKNEKDLGAKTKTELAMMNLLRKKVLLLLPLFLLFFISFNKQSYADEIDNNDEVSNFSYVATDLENGMTPSADFPSDMTVDEYLAQYTYPHLPKGGVTSSYQSVEVDLRTIDKTKIALVRNNAEWVAAISNANVEAISIMSSFAVSSNSSNGTAGRKLVIEGNNMLVDFKRTLASLGGSNQTVTIQNLNSYHGNYYGFVRPTGSGSSLNFHNINDYGSQIINSKGLPVKISGDFITRFTETSYISPIDGASVTAQASTQQNFESSDLEFLSDAKATLQTRNGINIELTGSGDITFGENATVDIIAANSTSGAGEHGYGYSIAAGSTTNKFVMKKGSKINYSYKNPGDGTRNEFGLLWFGGKGSSFSMEDGAQINISKDSHSGTGAMIYFNQIGAFSMDNKSLIDMTITDNKAGATAINLSGSGSTFDVKNGSKITTNFTSEGTGTQSIISLGAGSSLNIGKDSEMDITAVGYNNNIMTLGTGSNTAPTAFTVGENAVFNVNSTNRTSLTNDVVTVGNYANFTINRLGTFILSANKAKNLFNVGTNSTFSFTDAKLVEFGFTEEPSSTSSLIDMTAGNFAVDVQRVKAWNRSSAPLDADNPTFDWNPMFNMTIPYVKTAVTKSNIQGASTTPGTAESFKENYNSAAPNGFQKLRFDFIPDVTVSIDNQPVDNPDSIDSKTISGTASANAYIRLSEDMVPGGYNSFPVSNNLIENPSINLDGTKGEPYTTVADENGHFSFEVPTSSDIPFVAGSTIIAYAFKDGKSATTEVVVKDTTPPVAEMKELFLLKGSAVPNVNDFITKLTDSNPAGNPTASYVTPISTIESDMNTPGIYDIEIKVEDAAGNSATYTTKMNILDKESDITGNNVELVTNDINSLSNEEFQALLKTKIDATAYSIYDGNYEDLVSKINYDFSTVRQEAGSYTMVISVSEADSHVTGGLSKSITVNIENSAVKMQINQIYTDGKTPIYSDLTNKTPVDNGVSIKF